MTFLAILACPLLVTSPASADWWKDESGHGKQWQEWKWEGKGWREGRGEPPWWARGKGYWDGHFKHGRRWGPPVYGAPPRHFYPRAPRYYYQPGGAHYFQPPPIYAYPPPF